MSSTTLYKALLAAGVNEELATAAANDMIQSEQVATKVDLANMEVRLIKWMLGIVGLAVAILKLT